MRIRKQASKLLGWAYCSPFPSSSSPPLSAAQYSWPPPPSSSPESDAGELQCQLNLSPWDAIESPHYTNSQEAKLEPENEEEEMGVVRNGFENKEEEEEEGVEEKVVDKMGPARKRKEKGIETASGVIKCKKTDGKGWHCRRDAQLPHSLCSYHLTQLRSYRARFEDQLSGDGKGGRKNRRKKSAAAVETPGAASNYCYYYYSILGPWWGKRRGPLNEDEVGSGGNESSESNDKSEIAPQELNGKTDHEALADVDNGDDDEKNDGASCCNVTYKKKKRPLKKRGRKPVKARSLKSLL